MSMLQEQDVLRIASELRYQMAQIEASTIALRDTISECQLISARVFQLPKIPEGEEHNKITEIAVSTISGEQAFFMALQAYRKLYADRGISKKAAFRLPGYIQVYGQRDKIAARVNQLNEHKEQFKSTVQQLKGAKQKHDLIHKLFPGLITKQLYRRLHAVESDISTLSFIWAQRHVTYKTTKKEIEQKLLKQLHHPPSNCSKDDWTAFLNREIDDIKRLPEHTKLRIKRPAKVNPVVNLDCETTPQLSAHLPVIIVQKQPISATDLHDFDAKYRRCVRSDSKIGGIPVIDRLHLYIKQNAT